MRAWTGNFELESIMIVQGCRTSSFLKKKMKLDSSLLFEPRYRIAYNSPLILNN